MKSEFKVFAWLVAASAITFGAFAIINVAPGTTAADTQLTIGAPASDLAAMREKGTQFLQNTQADDGSWTSSTAPGISGLVAASLMEAGLAPEHPAVAKAIKHLESFVQKDGGIYYEKSNHRNYETCICMMVFRLANTDGKYDDTLANAVKFLRKLQWDEGEGLESSDTSYGGAGYGGHQRPDLSNTQFLVEQLKASGVDENDPALKKALIFISRAQNLESEHNTTEFASKVNDGGFYYTPAAGGKSQAGETPSGGLRSYASMTYAGLKSMIYAGLKPNDPRAKAAFNWIQKHYSLEENPGMGQQGLYYYYHTFAKALMAMEMDLLHDSKGVAHDWRKELASQLQTLQMPNGSWVNKAERWYEGDPNLATAYSLLALGYCDAPKVDKSEE